MRFYISTLSYFCGSYLAVSLTVPWKFSYELVHSVFLTGSMLCLCVFLRLYLASDSKRNGGSRGPILHQVTQGYGTKSTSRCLDHIGAPHRISISVREQGVGIFFGHLYAACILDDSRL